MLLLLNNFTVRSPRTKLINKYHICFLSVVYLFFLCNVFAFIFLEVFLPLVRKCDPLNAICAVTFPYVIKKWSYMHSLSKLYIYLKFYIHPHRRWTSETLKLCFHIQRPLSISLKVHSYALLNILNSFTLTQMIVCICDQYWIIIEYQKHSAKLMSAQRHSRSVLVSWLCSPGSTPELAALFGRLTLLPLLQGVWRCSCAASCYTLLAWSANSAT